MTGSTGQTQLSADDLRKVLLPSSLIVSASRVMKDYDETLSFFELPAKRARRILSAGAARISQLLLSNGLFELKDDESSSLSDEQTIFRNLERIHEMQR
jgi:hypothetical protein